MKKWLLTKSMKPISSKSRKRFYYKITRKRYPLLAMTNRGSSLNSLKRIGDAAACGFKEDDIRKKQKSGASCQ